MKKFIKFFIFAFFLAAFTYGGETSQEAILESKIVGKVISDLSRKNKPSVVIIGKLPFDEKYLIKYGNLNITNKKEKADFYLVTDVKNSKFFKKPAFALGYLAFFECGNCVGGFYWRKGRPQLILIKERLETFNLKIPYEYRNFVIPEKLVAK